MVGETEWGAVGLSPSRSPPPACQDSMHNEPTTHSTTQVQVQVQVCFTSVDGQVQPLDVALGHRAFCESDVNSSANSATSHLVYSVVSLISHSLDGGCSRLHQHARDQHYPSAHLYHWRWQVYVVGGRKGSAFTGDILGLTSVEVIDLAAMTSIHQATTSSTAATEVSA
jgi:hypothetical protein